MEENNKTPKEDLSYEELRRMYLGKKPKTNYGYYNNDYYGGYHESKASAHNESQEQNLPQTDIAKKDTTESEEDLSYLELKQKYLKGYGKEKSGYAYGKYGSTQPRSGVRLACDIVLFVFILVSIVLTVMFYAVPTIEIGGHTICGETQSMWRFLYGGENSVINEIKGLFETSSEFEENTDNALALFMSMLRLVFYFIGTAILLISMLIETIAGICAFCKKRSSSLGNVMAHRIASSLWAFLFIVLFGSVSNGKGEAAYYTGYTVGWGVTLGVLLNVAVVIGCSICLFAFYNKKGVIAKENKLLFAKSLLTGTICVAIGVAVTYMRPYSLLIYSLTSLLTTAASISQSGLVIKNLVFPVCNFFLFLAICMVCGQIRSNLINSFNCLLSTGQTNQTDYLKIKRIIEKKQNFLPVVIISFLSLTAVLLLNVPKFGFGWSVDIFNQLLIAFALSSLAQTLLSLFKSSKKDLTELSEIHQKSV